MKKQSLLHTLSWRVHLVPQSEVWESSEMGEVRKWGRWMFREVEADMGF